MTPEQVEIERAAAEDAVKAANREFDPVYYYAREWRVRSAFDQRSQCHKVTLKMWAHGEYRRNEGMPEEELAHGEICLPCGDIRGAARYLTHRMIRQFMAKFNVHWPNAVDEEG